MNTPKHAATLTKGRPGVLHGSYSYLIQDEEGQVVDPHSISAGWVLWVGGVCWSGERVGDHVGVGAAWRWAIVGQRGFGAVGAVGGRAMLGGVFCLGSAVGLYSTCAAGAGRKALGGPPILRDCCAALRRQGRVMATRWRGVVWPCTRMQITFAEQIARFCVQAGLPWRGAGALLPSGPWPRGVPCCHW